MKIAIVVEVNADEWAEEYAIEPGEVREDVIAYLKNGLQSCPVPMTVTVPKGQR